MRLYLVVLVLLEGCATAQLETKGYWGSNNALHWDQWRSNGVTLNYEDGSTRRISPQIIENLSNAHDRVAKASGLGWTPLGLVDMRSGADPVFQAFMTREGGPAITVSLGLLDTIGHDPDALAAILGHEMAHISLGHNEAEVKAREEKLKQSQQVGAGVSTGSAAVAVLIYRVGAMIYYRGLSRDEERAADDLGMQWAVKAGFDPCGIARALEATRSLGLPIVPFFSTHPGGGERVELANRYSREVNKRDCSEPGTPTVASAGAVAAKPEPAEADKSYAAAMAASRAGDHAVAGSKMRSLADAGYAPAQVMLGWWYQRGRGGLEKDEREAVRLFRLSAEQGHRAGEANLGFAYLQGFGGLAKDELEAARYFNRAAEKGDLTAAVQLGWIYWNGANGVPKDAAEAASLFRFAAEENHPGGQAALARMHFLGADDVARDHVEALRLYRLAAEGGHAGAQNNLALMRENGQGGQPKDVEEAVMWYRRAAAQGSSTAIRNLKRLGRE